MKTNRNHTRGAGAILPSYLTILAIGSLAWGVVAQVPHGALDLAGFAARSDEPDRRIPVDVLERRRAALFESLEPGIAVIRSADRRSSMDYPQATDFRQDNNFYYLTGLNTAESWLVMFRRAEQADSTVLYVPARDPQEEVWTGARIGAGPEASRRTGIPTVRPAEEFEESFIDGFRRFGPLREYERVFLPLGEGVANVESVVDAALAGGRTVSDLRPHLARLRLVKDSVELARLRKAITITGEALREGMKAARPGLYEYELEAVIEYVFHARGAERKGFPSIVGSGPNSVVLHYDENRRRMVEGDLVVVDVGAEYGQYTADITRTLPVNGVFSERQRAVYELVLATQRHAIDSIRPGRTVYELHQIAQRYMRENSDGLCGDSTCDEYMPHLLGHWIGMDIHDVGSYTTPLAPGMVLTVEPGIYLAKENLGIRIEDDVLVTADGHELLSTESPTTVDEIEALMALPSQLAESGR